MATGPEMYDTLRRATSELGVGSEFPVYTTEAYDLCKLTEQDLKDRGYTEEVAEEVVSALLDGDCGPLGRSMGLKLIVSPNAPRLLPRDT